MSPSADAPPRARVFLHSWRWAAPHVHFRCGEAPVAVVCLLSPKNFALYTRRVRSRFRILFLLAESFSRNVKRTERSQDSLLRGSRANVASVSRQLRHCGPFLFFFSRNIRAIACLGNTFLPRFTRAYEHALGHDRNWDQVYRNGQPLFAVA